MIFLDSKRAQEIIDSPSQITVLYHGDPVYIENVKDNNTAQVTYIDSHKKEEVPVYKLVEVTPNE